MKSIPFSIKNGKILINALSKERFVKVNEGKKGDLIIGNSNRSPAQNNALHLFRSQLSERLNDMGLPMQVILKPTYNIDWTTTNVKNHLWRPVQVALFGKESTTDLKKLEEIDKIHEIIMRELGEKHNVEYIKFPSKCPRCHHLDCVC